MNTVLSSCATHKVLHMAPTLEPGEAIQGYLYASSSNGYAIGTVSASPGNTFTIEFYFRRTVANTGAICILTIGSNTSNNSVCILCGNAGEFQITSGELSGPSVNRFTSTTNTVVNTWHHIAFVVTPSSIKIFVDGQSVSLTTASSTKTLNVNNNTLRLGQQVGGTTTFGRFKGNNINITNIRVTKKEVYLDNFVPLYRKLNATQSQRPNVNSIQSSECVLLMQVNTNAARLRNEINNINMPTNNNMVFGTTTLPTVV